MTIYLKIVILNTIPTISIWLEAWGSLHNIWNKGMCAMVLFRKSLSADINC